MLSSITLTTLGHTVLRSSSKRKADADPAEDGFLTSLPGIMHLTSGVYTRSIKALEMMQIHQVVYRFKMHELTLVLLEITRYWTCA